MKKKAKVEKHQEIDVVKFPFPYEPRLKNVKFIVFGDSYDFWVQCHNRVEIEQMNPGFMFQYHEFSKKTPCWGSGYFGKVNGILTLFVDASGAYMDWFKFEEYVFAMCGMKPGRDNHTDSNNFHNHIALLTMTDEQRVRALKKELKEKERDIAQLQRALEDAEPKTHFYSVKDHPTDHTKCNLCDSPLTGCHMGSYCSNEKCNYVDGSAWLTEKEAFRLRDKLEL
jgi:hypothetical protein